MAPKKIKTNDETKQTNVTETKKVSTRVKKSKKELVNEPETIVNTINSDEEVAKIITKPKKSSKPKVVKKEESSDVDKPIEIEQPKTTKRSTKKKEVVLDDDNNSVSKEQETQKPKRTTKKKEVQLDDGETKSGLKEPPNKSVTKISNNDENLVTEVERILDEKKREWATITTHIYEITIKREALEEDQKRLIKELTELMNRLKKDVPVIEGITIDSITPKNIPKPVSKLARKEIISTDSETESKTDSSDSESSDSESEKEKLVLPKKGTVKKEPVKKTKGIPKALQLSKSASESESDSDENSD
jgi:hypothetical protein